MCAVILLRSISEKKRNLFGSRCTSRPSYTWLLRLNLPPDYPINLIQFNHAIYYYYLTEMPDSEITIPICTRVCRVFILTIGLFFLICFLFWSWCSGGIYPGYFECGKYIEFLRHVTRHPTQQQMRKFKFLDSSRSLCWSSRCAIPKSARYRWP